MKGLFVKLLVGENLLEEFMFARRRERTKNFWNFTRPIPNSFYDGTTGIQPLDDTIKKINLTGYANYIRDL